MIHITAQMRVLVAIESVDGRLLMLERAGQITLPPVSRSSISIPADVAVAAAKMTRSR